jgi:hypothetical protein
MDLGTDCDGDEGMGWDQPVGRGGVDGTAFRTYRAGR